MAIEIFISYSHHDEEEKNELLRHLSVLRRNGLFDLWSDERIGIGELWKAEIEQALTRARVAILLVTKNFLNSEFIVEREVPEILKRHQVGLVIIPIIARDCAWRSVSWLSELNVFNSGLAIWRDGGAQVDKELADLTYLVDSQASVMTAAPEVQPLSLSPTHNHILFISSAYIAEKKRTWLSPWVPKQAILMPGMHEDLYNIIAATVSEQDAGGVSFQRRDDGVILTTSVDVVVLLNLAITIFRATKITNAPACRMAIHSGETAKATRNQRTKLPLADVFLSRRLMELGCEGQLVASQETADLLRKHPDFASLFHNSGRRTINPPDSIEVYNVYRAAISTDEESSFGISNSPLREVPETVVMRFHAPSRLRALKQQRMRVRFWPGRTYIQPRFKFKNSKGEEALGIRVDCHKHGEQGCSFEYREGDSKEAHRPKFKIVADNPSEDLSLVMEMSCYNEYDELLAPPHRHNFRLLRKPVLPSIKEPIQFFVWLWDRIMRLPTAARALVFAVMTPILIMAPYLLVPALIPKDAKDKLAYNYEFYKRKYWYGRDTYSGQPWEDQFTLSDGCSPKRWDYDPGQVCIVKGELGAATDGALQVLSGDRMVVPKDKDLGDRAFYDFSVRFKLKFSGDQAAWVFRSQPNRRSGYVFVLKKKEGDLVLEGFKYKDAEQPEYIDQKVRPISIAGTCCYDNDYFEIEAQVKDYTFAHQITITNYKDSEAKKRRGPARLGPYTLEPFVDKPTQGFRYGNVGLLSLGNGKMQVEFWTIKPYPFP